MKIAFITRELPISPRCGGIGHYVWDISNKLQNLGHQITIIAASDDYEQSKIEIENGIKIIFLPDADFYIGKNRILSSLYSKVRSLTEYRKYRQNVANCIETLIDNKEIDIVEFAEYGNEGYIWSTYARRIPMVVRLHGPSILDSKTQKSLNKHRYPIKYYYAKLEIETVSKADIVTSASNEMTSFFEKQLNFHFDNQKVIYNSINYKDWKKSIYKKNGSRAITIFSAGSVTEGKGYNELYEACKQLREDGYTIELEIAGKLGKLGRKLQYYSQTKDQTWLKVPGALSREQLRSLFNKADISIFPSWWESFGLVCIEAMASGALVIGSKKGGMAEIIEDGKDGFLVEPKNIEILKVKIKEVIALSTDKKFQVRKNAQQKVKEKFDSQVIVYKQLKFYEKVINKFNLLDDINFGVN